LNVRLVAAAVVETLPMDPQVLLAHLVEMAMTELLDHLVAMEKPDLHQHLLLDQPAHPLATLDHPDLLVMLAVLALLETQVVLVKLLPVADKAQLVLPVLLAHLVAMVNLAALVSPAHPVK